MAGNKSSASGPVDIVMDAVGVVLPDCGTALRLAKTGAERPLKLGERLRLRYNSRLCLYCSCKKEKFAEAMDAMREAEQTRKSS